VTDDRLYLIHITECIARVQQYVTGGKDVFLTNTMVQDAVLRNLQVLAESTQRISDPLRQQHTGVDWRGISRFRNVVTHNYLGIDLERIWDIVERDLPGLHREISAILSDLSED
jgi:uncharacterized protein with HEPN domain